MSASEERRERILELTRRHGFVAIEDLARRFSVTTQTIRRDINQLCALGALRRYHGGAGLPSSVENLAYSARQVLCLEEKRRIAALVARHVPDRASLFINIGTTNEEVARALMAHKGLHVITNNLNVAGILEGLEEILTVIRLGLPHELRRSLACTNIVENALGTVRQVTRNVKRWRHAEMALRWTAAGLLEAQKTFRRLKAYRQLPILRNALQEHLRKAQADSAIETIMKAA